MFYTYIIESLVDGSWYYGFTEDPEKRLVFHNEGLNRSTKGKRPWRYIFKREFLTKEEALRFERYLKATRNKKYILEKFSAYFL